MSKCAEQAQNGNNKSLRDNAFGADQLKKGGAQGNGDGIHDRDGSSMSSKSQISNVVWHPHQNHIIEGIE